jgi:hypothetical protein
MRAPRRENRGRGRGLTRDWPAIPSVVAGVIRNSFSEPKDVRRRLLDNLWIELRRFGAPNVRNIELSGIRDIQSVRVEGPVIRHSALIVSALSTLLECERIFDIGTSEGETSWLLAHNHPKARIYTFDAESSAPPAVRRRFHETIEASRITELRGDSATFDFSPYSGVIDLVHIDASRLQPAVRAWIHRLVRIHEFPGRLRVPERARAVARSADLPLSGDASGPVQPLGHRPGRPLRRSAKGFHSLPETALGCPARSSAGVMPALPPTVRGAS